MTLVEADGSHRQAEGDKNTENSVYDGRTAIVTALSSSIYCWLVVPL